MSRWQGGWRAFPQPAQGKAASNASRVARAPAGLQQQQQPYKQRSSSSQEQLQQEEQEEHQEQQQSSTFRPRVLGVAQALPRGDWPAFPRLGLACAEGSGGCPGAPAGGLAGVPAAGPCQRLGRGRQRLPQSRMPSESSCAEQLPL